MAKAAGIAPGQADALGKWVDHWAAGPEAFGELTDKVLEDHRIVTPRNERRMERSIRDRMRDGIAFDDTFRGAVSGGGAGANSPGVASGRGPGIQARSERD